MERFAMGISPVLESGVGRVPDDDGVEPPRRSVLVDGESWGAICELRLCLSIMLTAHSCKSTGVRLAAWRKASVSCNRSA